MIERKGTEVQLGENQAISSGSVVDYGRIIESISYSVITFERAGSKSNDNI